MIWVPSEEDKQFIIDQISQLTGLEAERMQLNPTLRKNVLDMKGRVSMNVALVSQDPMYDDTEVVDYTAWEEFTAGVPLTRDGRAKAIVDFLLRDNKTWLPIANPVVIIDGGVIRHIALRHAEEFSYQ